MIAQRPVARLWTPIVPNVRLTNVMGYRLLGDAPGRAAISCRRLTRDRPGMDHVGFGASSAANDRWVNMWQEIGFGGTSA